MTLAPAIAFLALGAILASFAGVIAERLNTGTSWAAGRSRCNACARALDALDLVPVVSWLIHRGGCRTCRARIPYRYALTEATLGLLFLASYLREGLTPALLALLASLFLLAIVVLYDLRHTVVPMRLALPLIATAALYAYLAAPDARTLGVVLLTGGAIAAAFLVLHLVSGGRWMGLGDAPIVLALSFLAGTNAVSGLLFSFWIGALIGIGILVARPGGHRMGIEVPFVPFLAAGYLLALFTQWNPFLF